jgi:hypothetical protein
MQDPVPLYESNMTTTTIGHDRLGSLILLHFFFFLIL